MPLAKRRLLAYGPLTPGRDALRTAVIVVAAELSLQGVSEESAVAVCLGMDFETGTTSARALRKSIPDWVRWAYHPKDGLPVLSGCPQINVIAGSERGSKLREAFAGYCNNGCQLTCASFKLTRMPEGNLIGTDYEPILVSALWMPAQSGGLGMEAKRLYSIIASIAVAEKANKVMASSTYLTRRTEGHMAARTIRKHMARLREHGLIRQMNKHSGEYWIEPMPLATIDALSEKLGVAKNARWNVIEAHHESLRKAEQFPTWEAEEFV